VGLFRRRSREGALKIFYAADIHGSETCFRKFLKAADFYDVDVLVLGGDLTGKALVPVVRGTGGTWKAKFLGRTAEARDEGELEALEAQIRFNGFYPYRCDPDELNQLETDPKRRAARFDQVMREDIFRWMGIAEDRLRESPVRCLMMPGNDDGDYVAEALEASERVENAEERIVEVQGFLFLSLGYSNITPWHTPRELSEEELGARISPLVEALDPSLPWIFNLHVPPYDTRIDDAPELDETLRLIGGSGARMVPVGSHAVRAAIEEQQPLLSLHGHIHESRGLARLGKTQAINPGSEYNVGVLRGVIVAVEPNRVVGHQFVGG
jgi:Icc-related predicted phosphoesterase